MSAHHRWQDVAEVNQLARDAGVPATLDAEAVARISEFLDLRDRWSATHNVSGPRALADPWRVDVVDGLAVAAVLGDRLPLADVGSGSGVPGLLVACLDPRRPVRLIEPLAKRAALLRTAAHALRLAEVVVIRAHWPVKLDQAVQVVSRAVVAPEAWPALAASGGAHVRSVVRMLAAARPPFGLPGWTPGPALDYASSRGPRRVERWDATDVDKASNALGVHTVE